MSGKFRRMEFVKELQLRPRIKLELESGEIFSVDYLPSDVADELVKRWNAYEDRATAIPPRDPTEEMLRAGMRELNHNWLRSPPSDMWRAMYDAALAEKEGR